MILSYAENAAERCGKLTRNASKALPPSERQKGDSEGYLLRYSVTPFQKLIKPPLDPGLGKQIRRMFGLTHTSLERCRQLYCERAEVAIPRDRSLRISDGAINQGHLSKFDLEQKVNLDNNLALVYTNFLLYS